MTKFDPPLQHGDVLVTSIYPEIRRIHIIVYISHDEQAQIVGGKLPEEVTEKVNVMVHYLELEGYIPAHQNWLTNIGAVIKE